VISIEVAEGEKRDGTEKLTRILTSAEKALERRG
jgi:hypothetical protein